MSETKYNLNIHFAPTNITCWCEGLTFESIEHIMQCVNKTSAWITGTIYPDIRLEYCGDEGWFLKLEYETGCFQVLQISQIVLIDVEAIVAGIQESLATRRYTFTVYNRR
jgi:hypothetical protein